MNIEQFISKLESSDAYQNNKAVRRLVSESRQVLIDLAGGGDRDAFMAEFVKFKDQLDIALKPLAAPSAETVPASPEANELIEKLSLREQYATCLKTLSFYGFLGENGEAKKGDVPRPSFEKAIAVFTPEMLALAATFQEPTLLLVPETSFVAKVKAIDAHKAMKGQVDTYQTDLYKKSDSGSETITGWKAVIVDGAKEMPLKEDDDTELTFAERIKNRKTKPGEKGMERHAYALLMMESLRKGEPIDKDTYTLLDDDPALSASGVPRAYWYDDLRRVRFDAYGPGVVLGAARLRSVVGGDVVLSATKSSESTENPEVTSETYKVVVDYFLDMPEAIAAGEYDNTNPDITDEHFPPYSIPQDYEPFEVEIHLVHFGREVTTAEVMAELDRLGLAPATLPELLALGAAFPDLQRKSWIAALGSRWSSPGGSVHRPLLSGDDGGRELSLYWDDPDDGWGADYRFAAVRK